MLLMYHGMKEAVPLLLTLGGLTGLVLTRVFGVTPPNSLGNVSVVFPL
jgi:hypothetical protein